MTLIEMLMAIIIFTLGIAGFSLLFLKIWGINSFVLEEGQSINITTQSLNEIIKDLRKVRQGENSHYAIQSGNNFDLVVYLDEDNDAIVERVHYFLDQAQNQLKKGVTKPSGSPMLYPAEDEEIRVIANNIVNSQNQPIFYYYNKFYPIDSINNPLSVPIIPTDVRLIKIHLFLNIKPQSAPENINIESFVELRNLNENQ